MINLVMIIAMACVNTHDGLLTEVFSVSLCVLSGLCVFHLCTWKKVSLLTPILMLQLLTE